MDNHIEACLARRTAAAAKLGEREPNLPAERITNSLVDGLNTLRQLLFKRIHEDVEEHIGRDSMLLPVSAKQSEEIAKAEIETYQVAVSAIAARDRNYVSTDFNWYAKWLGHLRLGQAIDEKKYRRRLKQYVSTSDDEQRLGFSRSLETVFPEASRAPLILYRLYPLAVRIVSAVAFGAHLDAAELRNRQMFWLPAVADCHECHGRPLDNGDQCAVCGNPIWSYGWLNAD